VLPVVFAVQGRSLLRPGIVPAAEATNLLNAMTGLRLNSVVQTPQVLLGRVHEPDPRPPNLLDHLGVEP
jgi:hypothetical protein